MNIRGLQRDVVFLDWPIAPYTVYTSPNAWGGGVAGSQPMTKAVHITWHGAQINFEDLTPYLTYDEYQQVSWLEVTVADCRKLGRYVGPKKGR